MKCIVLLFLIIILLYLIFKKKEPNETFTSSIPQKSQDGRSVAIYSCNFGNYRNELKNGIDNIKFDPHIDYYFFTDNDKLTSKKWKIIRPPKKNGDDVMDSNRWTSKYVKFVLPNNLKQYDIVVWYDSKIIKKPLVKLLDYNQIVNKISKHNIVHLIRPWGRTKIQEELRTTISMGLENKDNGEKFLKEINNKTYSVPLVDTCVFIRKTDPMTNNLFENVYYQLKEKKLKRDQNIYSYVIDKLNYPTDSISYSLSMRNL